MDEIRSQVQRARRRLNLQQFVQVWTWSMLIAVTIAGFGIAIPKIWAISIDSTTWTYAWLAGGVIGGLLLSGIWNWIMRRGELDAAIELDKRFGLKERVSSALSLPASDAESEAGQALLEDARRRVSGLEVKDQFGVQTGWQPILPVALLGMVMLLAFFVGNATPEQKVQASNAITQEVKHQIQTSADSLKKRLEEKKKEAAAKGLKDAETLFTKLERGLDDLNKQDNLDRKKALIKINDLAKELAERQKQLANNEQMKQQLSQLKNMTKGPADRMAKAMKEGDFKKAMDEVSKMQEKMKNGELSEEDQKKIAEQLSEMQQKLEEMVQQHEQAKRDLQEMIEQKKREGDLASAGEMQRKLDQMKQQDQSMAKMAQMASQMQNAAQALQQGKGQQASEQMQQLAQQLQDMQSELDELQTLSEAMDQIADAKNAMSCSECQGAGCAACQSSMMSNMAGQMSNRPGNGMGDGQGQGDRPEEATDTAGYRSRVAGDPRKGEAVRVGDADGPNRAGQTLESVKEEVASSYSQESDPLVNVKLPRREREHLKEYFERLRKGKGE